MLGGKDETNCSRIGASSHCMEYLITLMVSHVNFNYIYVLSEGYHFCIIITQREYVLQTVAVYFPPYFRDKAIADDGVGCDMGDIFIFDIKCLS